MYLINSSHATVQGLYCIRVSYPYISWQSTLKWSYHILPCPCLIYQHLKGVPCRFLSWPCIYITSQCNVREFTLVVYFKVQCKDSKTLSNKMKPFVKESYHNNTLNLHLKHPAFFGIRASHTWDTPWHVTCQSHAQLYNRCSKVKENVLPSYVQWLPIHCSPNHICRKG